MGDRKIVVVDVDNTIHESDITLNLASMELFNSPFRWCQQGEWYKGGHDKMPMENALKVFSRIYDRDMIFLTRPYVGAKAGLEAIKNAGYDIYYYTDRPEKAHENTYDWLVEHGLPDPENLKCCGDKRASLAEIKDSIATVIDDRVRTILYAQYELGIPKVFSITQPYNRNLTDAPNVFLRETWKELTEVFLEEMGKCSSE
jgi:hypothetical protein